MTETCGGAIQTQPFDSDEIRCTRVGRIMPADCAGLPEYDGCLIKYQVADPKNGEICKPGEPGELWCRGSVVTKGYFNRPEVNEKVFTEDGWFKTGDCGYFDENGYLCLSGRIDDMYKINGENVSPKFLEDTVSACFKFESGLPGSGSWCFVAHESAKEDRIEIIGDKGMLSFSVFTYEPIILHTERGIETFQPENPPHVQLPLIQAVVEHLQGKSICTCDGLSATTTNWVMDRILNKL
jgi:acyl-CoA synthetase (AMP-forming)/AMP-acid ligase II